ncbi:MAG: carbonic anhydrase, partial [Planctomycetota bacterium]
AVSQLNTNLIVVLGHEKCGAVGAALQNATTTTDMGYNLNTLVGHLTPAVAAAQKKKRAFNTDPLTTTVKENAKLSAQELRTRSPIIASERGVKIVSGYYHLIKGKVEFSDFL